MNTPFIDLNIMNSEWLFVLLCRPTHTYARADTHTHTNISVVEIQARTGDDFVGSGSVDSEQTPCNGNYRRLY